MMPRKRIYRAKGGIAALSILLAIAAVCHCETAAAVCIASGNAAGLLAAISDAAESGNPATIKLEQGSYLLHGNIYEDRLTADFRIFGGYLPTQGHSCDEAQRSWDARKTELLLDGFLGLFSDNTLVAIEALTIDSQGPGGSNGFGVGGDSANVVEIKNVRFTNQTTWDPVFFGYYGADSTEIKLTNVQFDHLISIGDGSCSIAVELGGHGRALLNHVTTDLAWGDFCVDSGWSGGNKHVSIWNSIFWDSLGSGGILRTRRDPTDSSDGIAFDLNDVDFTDFNLAPADSVIFDPRYPTVQFDPFWSNPAAGDYTLVGGPNSVAVNTGTIDFQAGEPEKDIFGDNRQTGSKPDMGAHESPYDDIAGGNVFIVTNTNDVFDENSPLYPGSLRAALQKASTVNGASLIKFALPTCPSVITLNSPLPLVWQPLIIDGYSMTGSSANSDPSGFFNATLCVALQPANTASTPSALIVPSGGHDASLTVKGLGFGGFSQAIQLWGGYSHQIVGNQFGGVMNGMQLFGFDTAGVRIETSGSVIVGGSSVADHNVFQNANSAGDAAGVVVGIFTSNMQTVCQIVGNLFGITPDGFSAIPNNKYGILLQGNGCLVEGNRMAGNIKDAIYILGGSNHVIQNNVIGPAMFFGQDFSNPGAGIRIAAGGANNIIGAPPGFGGSYYANVIKDMDLGGVLAGGDGSGNSVRGNQISDNGLLTGLNLDLGLDGPTANDPGDVDNGVNGLMNYPEPHGLQWTNGTPALGTFNIPAHLRGRLDVAPGHYQLDAYYDDTCGSAGRGGGKWVGGAVIDVMDPAAMLFDVPVTIPAYDAEHGQLSFTATSETQNSTSEFSECLSVDRIFYDGFGR
jgi:hypothetical protein